MWRGREEHSAHTCYKILGIVSELCKLRPLTPTFPTAPPRRLTQMQPSHWSCDNEAHRTVVSWARDDQSAWLWHWPKCPLSQHLNLPTFDKRQSAPCLHLLPMKTWWLWLPAQHTPSLKRGCQSCQLFSTLIRPTCILFGWKNQRNRPWTCSYFPLLLWFPTQPKTRLALGGSQCQSYAEAERSSFRVTWALQGSTSFVRSSLLLSRNKMMPTKEWEFPVQCGVREVAERALSLGRRGRFHWLEIPPLIWIYSYYFLCFQLPGTCSNVHNPPRVVQWIIHDLLLHLRLNELFGLYSNETATSAAGEQQAGKWCFGGERSEKSRASCSTMLRH